MTLGRLDSTPPLALTPEASFRMLGAGSTVFPLETA